MDRPTGKALLPTRASLAVATLFCTKSAMSDRYCYTCTYSECHLLCVSARARRRRAARRATPARKNGPAWGCASSCTAMPDVRSYCTAILIVVAFIFVVVPDSFFASAVHLISPVTAKSVPSIIRTDPQARPTPTVANDAAAGAMLFWPPPQASPVSSPLLTPPPRSSPPPLWTASPPTAPPAVLVEPKPLHHRGARAINPLPPPSPGVDMPCCRKFQPEPSRVGRCTNKALPFRGKTKCDGDKHFTWLCPVGCGSCRMCPTQPFCYYYRDLYKKLGTPPRAVYPTCAESRDLEIYLGCRGIRCGTDTCKTSQKFSTAPAQILDAHVNIGRLAVQKGDVATLRDLAHNVAHECFGNGTESLRMDGRSVVNVKAYLRALWRRLRIEPIPI